MTAPCPTSPVEVESPAGSVALPRPAVPVIGPGAIRVLAAAVLAPVLTSYAAVVALVVLLSTTANAQWSLSTTLRSAAPLWLAVHQVPLTITVAGGSAAPLGMLPLLPTLGLVALVAAAAAGAVARLDWHTPARLACLAAGFAAAHALLGVTIALVGPVSRMTASPVAAGCGCAAVAGIAALFGGLRAAGFGRVASAVVPQWAVRGVLAGVAGLAGLLAVGALATLAGLLLSIGTVRELVAGWSGSAGGELGVTVLSIAYLPNAVVAALSWAAGPGLSIGAVSVSPFGATAGTLPAVPLLAALPEPGRVPWLPVVLLLPVLVGVFVGQRCRRFTDDRTDRLHAAVTAATVAAAGCFLLALAAGGQLGAGEFDPVRVPAASLAIAVFVLVVLPAGLVVGLPGRGAEADSFDGMDEYDDVSDGVADGVDEDVDEDVDEVVDGEPGVDGEAGPDPVDRREPVAATAAGTAGQRPPG